MAPAQDTPRHEKQGSDSTASSSSSLLLPTLRPPPRITYSRRDKPLSLTGGQFKRDTYAIPSDNDDDRNESAGSRYDSVAAAEGMRLLQLSTLSKGGTKRKRPPRNAKMDAASHFFRGVRDGEETCSKTPKERRNYDPRPTSNQDGRQASAAKVTKFGSNRKARDNQQYAAQRKRRLPVGELTLVASPPIFARQDSDDSDLQSIGRVDPIIDQSSRSLHPCLHRTQSRAEVPLTALRKRLKISHIRLKDLRKSLESRRIQQQRADDVAYRGADGFDDCELHVSKDHVRSRKMAARKRPPILGFAQLRLQSGPLPEVHFQCTATELALERPSKGADHNVVCLPDSRRPFLSETSRQISSNTRVRERTIRNQLSSISAPARPPSESSDDEEGEGSEGDFDMEDEVYAATADGSAYSCSPPPADGDPVYHPTNATRPLRQKAQPLSVSRAGVMIDFRQPVVPGQLPKQPLGKQRLVEVSEAIIEAPETPDLVHLRSCTGSVIARHRPSDATNPQHSRTATETRAPIVPNSTSNDKFGPRDNDLSSIDTSRSRYFANASDFQRAPTQSTRTFAVPRSQSG